METGIVIPVPELESFTSRWRPVVDAVPLVDVPAHITLLYPFVSSGDLGHETRAVVAALFSDQEPFGFELVSVGRFNDDVVYLRPEPVAPFIRLTGLLTATWPTYPPYGGDFDEVVPHLTIGSGCTPEGVEAVTRAVEPLLPVSSKASEVWLMVGRKAMWQVGDRFPIGSPGP